MADLFNRQYELQIQESTGVTKVFRNLNILFRADKTNNSSANKLDLSIINLNKSSRDFIDKAGITVTLSAGYQDRDVFGIIFKGKIDKDGVTHEKADTDWISKVIVKDGIGVLRSTVLSKSFAPGTAKSTVINSIIDSLGLARGTIKDLPDTIYKSGKSLFGSAKDSLDTITESEGLQWYVNDEVINIVKEDENTNDEVISLSASSGLISTPEKTEKGYKFKTLLRPGINPGTLINIKSKIINDGNDTLFIVRSITHIGEFDGQNWFSEIEAKRR